MTLKHISPSLLDTADTCHKLYFEKYINKNREVPKYSEPLLFGSLIHKALEIMAEKQLGKDDITDVVQTALKETKESIPIKLIKRAENTLETWWDPKKMENVRFTELQFGLNYKGEGEPCNIGPYKVMSYIDKVQEYPNYYKITDYKSGNFFYTKEDTENSIQLLFYAVLLRQKFGTGNLKRKPIVIQYDMVEQCKSNSYMCTEEDIDRAERTIITKANKINKITKPTATTSWKCTWCHLRSECKEYQAWLVEDEVDIPESIMDEDFETVLETINDLDSRKKAIDTKTSKMKKQLVKAMQESEKKKVEYGQFSISIASKTTHHYRPQAVFTHIPQDRLLEVISVKNGPLRSIMKELSEDAQVAILESDEPTYGHPYVSITKRK